MLTGEGWTVTLRFPTFSSTLCLYPTGSLRQESLLDSLRPLQLYHQLLHLCQLIILLRPHQVSPRMIREPCPKYVGRLCSKPGLATLVNGKSGLLLNKISLLEMHLLLMLASCVHILRPQAPPISKSSCRLMLSFSEDFPSLV